MSSVNMFLKGKKLKRRSLDPTEPREVKMYYDPKLVEKYKKDCKGRTEEEKRIDEKHEKENRKNGSVGSSQSVMGLEASLGKDDRKFKLQSLFNRGEVFTVKSAMSELGLAKGTIHGYLRELGLQLWDTERKEFVGAKEGKRPDLPE